MGVGTEIKKDVLDVLEIVLVWWVLNHIHTRKPKKHQAEKDWGERVKKATEEDEDAVDAEESFEEPATIGPGMFTDAGPIEDGAGALMESVEFVALL
jgi:hypothetical protein